MIDGARIVYFDVDTIASHTISRSLNENGFTYDTAIYWIPIDVTELRD